MLEQSKNPHKKSRLYTNLSILILCVNSFVVALGYGLVQPMLAFYLLALEGAITEPPSADYMVPEEAVAEFAIILSLMLSAFMMTRSLLSRYWGGLSDAKGRRPVIIGGLVGYCVFFALFGLGRNWIDLLLVRLGLGAASAAVWPTGQAAIVDLADEERRGEAMGLYVFSLQVGWFSGPGIGGLLYNFCRDVLELPIPLVFQVPYFIAALIVLPTPFLTYFALKEPIREKLIPQDFSEATASIHSSNERKNDVSAMMRQRLNSKTKKQINALYILFISNGISMGLSTELFQLFLMSRITSDVATIGFLISGAGLIGIMMNIPAGRLSDKYGRKKLALWSGIASRGAMGVFPLTNTVSQATLVYIARSGTWAVHQPVTRALQGDIIPLPLRGKLFGSLQAVFNFGAAIGPLVGGWLFSIFSLTIWQLGSISIEGIGIPFWLSTFSGLIGLMCFAKYITETRSKDTRS